MRILWHGKIAVTKVCAEVVSAQTKDALRRLDQTLLRDDSA
jgi:hypothetical protein